jgi:2Fe-2S ferredoxin
MTLLRVVDRDGVEHEVEGHTGFTLMENLRDLDYGVAAICGGMCACATCHVYVEEGWAAKLPAAQSDELDLIDDLLNKRDNSRLSCQVKFGEQLDGLKVQIAPDE